MSLRITFGTKADEGIWEVNKNLQIGIGKNIFIIGIGKEKEALTK